MKRVIAIGFVLVLAGATLVVYRLLQKGQLPLTQRIDVRLGEAVFRQNCAVCHGPGAEGRDLAPPLNHTGHAHHHPDWELYMVITDGRAVFGEMPGWKGKLSDREIRSVIAYIKTLWADDQRMFHQRLNQLRPAPP